jgi:hypothetical protein
MQIKWKRKRGYWSAEGISDRGSFKARIDNGVQSRMPGGLAYNWRLEFFDGMTRHGSGTSPDAAMDTVRHLVAELAQNERNKLRVIMKAVR